MFSSFYRITSKVYNIGHFTTKHASSVAWLDKLFVNYLKVPNYMRIHGPTGEEITKDIDLNKKTCVITGGTSGIGTEIIRCLLARNCNVAIACRNLYAAGVAARNVWGNPNLLSTYNVDLASLATVKQCTEQILNDHKKIDLVILNAAVFGLPWTMTVDKLETIFQVNFLAQYLFLLNIEQNLAPDARIVFMSSESHRHLKWSVRDTLSPTEDLVSLPKENYTSIRAYNISKLCGILCMHYLSNKGRSVFCAHPGSFVSTNLSTNWWPYELLYTSLRPFTKTIAQASATPLYCATSPKLRGISNVYVKDCRICNASDLAQNNHLAFRIMDLTHDIIKDRFEMLEERASAAPYVYDQKEEAKGSIEESVLSA